MTSAISISEFFEICECACDPSKDSNSAGGIFPSEWVGGAGVIIMPEAVRLAEYISPLRLLALAWRFCGDVDCRPSVVWSPMGLLMPEGAPRVPAHCGSAVDDLTTKRIGQ